MPTEAAALAPPGGREQRSRRSRPCRHGSPRPDPGRRAARRCLRDAAADRASMARPGTFATMRPTTDPSAGGHGEHPTEPSFDEPRSDGQQAGSRLRRPGDGACRPGGRGRLGSGRVEQNPMQPRPDSGPPPAAQTAPAGHARPAAHLTWQHLPGLIAGRSRVSAARSGTRGRWPCGRCGRGGCRCASSAHSAPVRAVWPCRPARPTPRWFPILIGTPSTCNVGLQGLATTEICLSSLAGSDLAIFLCARVAPANGPSLTGRPCLPTGTGPRPSGGRPERWRRRRPSRRRGEPLDG